MISNACGGFRTCPLSRRGLLRVGGLGLFGLNLAGLWRAQARPPVRAGAGAARGPNRLPPVKACILLYQPGGPGHHDTWDMKPDAPLEIRGEFRPIATRVPGL